MECPEVAIFEMGLTGETGYIPSLPYGIMMVHSYLLVYMGSGPAKPALAIRLPCDSLASNIDCAVRYFTE